jgi:cytochrome c peroxidase
VFEAHCSRCHGTYGKEWTYPNLVIGLEEIGTDPELALKATQEADRFLRWYNNSFFGEISYAAPAPGYIAPPLDGVWATAPYLHNGSVPSIETLLDSTKRPQYWTRSFDSTDYDKKALGWNYTTLTHGKEGAANPEERKRIYDTTLPGYSNQGHKFGDSLSDTERAAVLEYLKTL